MKMMHHTICFARCFASDRAPFFWRDFDITYKAAIDAWPKKEAYHLKGRECELHVNRTSLQMRDQSWVVQLIDEKFGRLMCGAGYI